MDRRNLLAAGAALAATGAAPEGAGGPDRRFVLIHSPGPKWEHGKSFGDQPGLEAHVGYMRGLLASGRLVEGGPFLDDSGGMMVFEVATLEDAHAIAQNDPTVQGGLLQVSVHPWLRALVRSSGSSPG